MVKKSLIWTYRAALSALWLTIIVLTLSILTLRYFVLPNIDGYKEQIAEIVSQAAGRRVTIGRVEASWNGMNPHLSLRQVAIYDDENRIALNLYEVETSLSWLSIPLLEPKLASLLIQGPVLSIRREADGSLIVAGIRMGGDASPELANWVLRQSRIDIVDATVLWQDDLRKAPQLMLSDLKLTIESPVWESLIDRHRFALQATPSAGASQPIELRGNLYGADVGKLKDWSGTIYGRMDGTDIAAWRQWLDYPFDISAGYGAARFWLDFTDGRNTRLTSDLVLQKVRARFSKNTAEADFNALAGRLIWASHADGQSINLERINLSTASGLKLENGSLGLRERLQNGKELIEGNVMLDEMNVASISAFSTHLPLPKASAEQFAKIAPVGLVDKLEFSWQGSRNALNSYALRMQFKNLGIQAHDAIPGFTNLSGTLKADEKQGTLNLNSQQTTLDLKNVMRWPIPAEKLSGVIKWSHHAQGTDVRVTNLSVSSQHLAGAVNALYKHSKTGPASIELNGRFDRGDAKYAPFYYPRMLGNDTLNWLDSSILAGDLSDIHVIVRGRVDQFPFNKPDQGLFKVSADIKQAVLDYAIGWPAIQKLNANLLFQGARMEINADGGTILGNRIKQVKAVIPVLDADDPQLDIEAETDGNTSDGVQFINNSPVRQLTEGFTDQLRTSGNGQLRLKLQIPLNNVDATRVKGEYTMTDSGMSSPSVPELAKINGILAFTESSISAKNIAATIYNSPARIDISSGNNRLVKVTARGNLTSQGLRQMTGSDISRLVNGNTDWLADITILPQKTDVVIRSSLQGVTLDLPPPLGKTAGERMALRLEKRQHNAAQDTVRITLGDNVTAVLQRSLSDKSSAIERGEIGINETANLPEQAGISLRASFDQLDLDRWLDLLDPWAGKSTGGGKASASISRATIHAATLDAFGRRLHALNLNMARAGDGWQGQLQSQEISGDVRWLEKDNGKIIARLKQFALPEKTPPMLSTAPDSSIAKKPLNYPDLDIVADHFQLGRKVLGKLELLATERNETWHMDQIRISNNDSLMQASGEWSNWRRNPVTQMTVNWNINDLGNTLARYGHPDLIYKGSAKLNGRLRWPGSPQDFNVEQLSGNFTLDAGTGQILKIKPGVGRLFSVLTLQNLPRRLTLDFRDVLSSGFTFDKISANASITQGVMRSDNFLMEGPTAKVEMRGETDLKKETQHLHVKVTPFVSDSVSLAALAGGPAVAAAAFVAQKLLKDPLNKIVAEEYEITGTWDHPVDNKQQKPEAEAVKTIPGQ
jgi:uncharacterized protein (TIGR02099 family)